MMTGKEKEKEENVRNARGKERKRGQYKQGENMEN